MASIACYFGYIIFASFAVFILDFLNAGFLYIAIVVSIIAFAFIVIEPVLMYVIGEWAGRSSPNLQSALMFVFEATVILTLIIFSIFYFIALQISEQEIQSISQEMRMITTIFPTTRSIVMAFGGGVAVVHFGTIWAPLTVGAYRGARYKTYYDLAFFAGRLESSKQSEIADFVRIIAEEYGRASTHQKP